MNSSVRTSISLLALVVVAGSVLAGTWLVEKDGTGHFTVIQEALDASSPGDTILIGPGRFTETNTVVLPGWTNEIYAAVWNDSIMIIGSGVDVTIIGPDEPLKQPINDRPKGIFGGYNTVGGRISHLTVENVRDGVVWESGLEIEQCNIRGCVDALIALPTTGLLVADMLFENNSEDAINAWGPCPDMRVVNCEFIDNGVGISVVSLGYLLVEGCEFSDYTVGVQYDHTIGEVRDCRFNDGRSADVVSIGSHLTLSDCRLSSAYTAISASTWGFLWGSGNIIPAGEGPRLRICNTLFYFNGNHIFRTDGSYIELDCYISQPHDILDFTGNYWGTTSADSISAAIWDGHDDPEIHAYVDFTPFSPTPVAGERKSWSDLKSMFR
ncbi:right-handed parallel beta-helix repeat-containing protein [bacterium]|nr:right-handed parallel beta-helix repeat-containing protein [bacterium]